MTQTCPKHDSNISRTCLKHVSKHAQRRRVQFCILHLCAFLNSPVTLHASKRKSLYIPSWSVRSTRPSLKQNSNIIPTGRPPPFEPRSLIPCRRIKTFGGKGSLGTLESGVAGLGHHTRFGFPLSVSVLERNSATIKCIPLVTKNMLGR